MFTSYWGLTCENFYRFLPSFSLPTYSEEVRPVYDRIIEATVIGDSVELPVNIGFPTSVHVYLDECTNGDKLVIPILRGTREMSTQACSSIARGISYILDTEYRTGGFAKVSVSKNGSICKFSGCRGILLDEDGKLLIYTTVVRSAGESINLKYNVNIDKSVFTVDTLLNKTLKTSFFKALTEISNTNGYIYITIKDLGGTILNVREPNYHPRRMNTTFISEDLIDLL